MDSKLNANTDRTKMLSPASLVCGILAAVLCWFTLMPDVWFFSIIAVVFGIIAILLYFLSIKKTNVHKTINIVGLVLGIIGLVVGLIFTAMWLFLGKMILTQFKGFF